MNTKQIISITLAAATIIAYAAFGQQSQPPVRLILDGQDIATLSDFKYDPGSRELKVKTLEMLGNCEEGRIHIDRFEVEP